MATPAIEVPSKRPSLRERLDLGHGLTPYFLVLPTILLTAWVAFYPILDSFWFSLINNPLSSAPQIVGLNSYVQLVANSEFRSSISTTLIFTFIAVTLETIFGLGIAVLLHGKFPGRSLVMASILVPWAFPTVVSAQMWQLMYNDRTGIITYLLQGLHLLAPGDTLLRTNSGIMTAAIIADVWKNTPFIALLLLAGLQIIPDELYEAANVDGATRFQQFRTITLPMLNGPLTVALLFRTLAALGVFDLFYVLGGNQVQSMALYSYNFMFNGSIFDFTSGVAAAVVLFVIVVVQIAYRFSAMLIILKGVSKLTAVPKSDQRAAKQVQKGKEL